MGQLIFGGKRRLHDNNIGKNYLKGRHKLYLRRRDGSWLIDRLFAARWKLVAGTEARRGQSRQVMRQGWQSSTASPGLGRKRPNLAHAHAREVAHG